MGWVGWRGGKVEGVGRVEGMGRVEGWGGWRSREGGRWGG